MQSANRGSNFALELLFALDIGDVNGGVGELDARERAVENVSDVDADDGQREHAGETDEREQERILDDVLPAFFRQKIFQKSS